MTLHLLSGDSLVDPIEKTGIEGTFFVCRECLVDGPRDTTVLEDFWVSRKLFLDSHYGGAQNYQSQVVDQYTDLLREADGQEVVLWFERELFCQINFLFSLWMLRNTNARLSVAYPPLGENDSVWKSWAELGAAGLRTSYENRIRMNQDDALHGARIWEAFSRGDLKQMKSAARSRSSNSFPTIERIAELVEGLDTEPAAIVVRLIEEHGEAFDKVFRAFCQKHPEYGLGDLQLKRIFDGVRPD